MFLQVLIELRALYIGLIASYATNTFGGCSILNTYIRIGRCDLELCEQPLASNVKILEDA